MENLNRTLYNIISSAHNFQREGKPADGALKAAVSLLDSMALDVFSHLQLASRDQQDHINDMCHSVKACQHEYQASKAIVAQNKASFESVVTEHTACRTDEVKAKDSVGQCTQMVQVSKMLERSACKALSDYEDSAGSERTHIQVVTRAPGESVKDYLNRITGHFCGSGSDCKGILCRWNEKDEMCTGARDNSTSEINKCNMRTQSYENQKISCNGVQKRMDDAACKYALFSKQACDNYKKCHAQTIKPYLMLKANARENEKARKKQWRVMMRMRCMLTLLLNEGYQPNDKALDECKSKPKESYNPKHLDLQFNCNLEPQLCTKATLYPGSDSYKTMLSNLPKDAPVQESNACGGLGEGVGDLLKKNMIPGAGEVIGSKNRGLTEDIYFFPQKCDFPDLQARRPTITRGVPNIKFPPWTDENHDAFAGRFKGYVQIRQPGVYKFWVESRAGSQVFINEQKVYKIELCRKERGGGIEGPVKLRLKEGFAKLRVELHANERPEKIQLKYQGPDTYNATMDVPIAVLFKITPSPVMVHARRNGAEKIQMVTGTCTCGFTVHTHLFSVYVDGIDMTSKVQGDINTWDEKKTLRFPCGADTLLAVSGADSDKGCKTGGFAMMCTSSDQQSPWQKYIADQTWKVFASTCADGTCSADNKKILNMPHGWYLPVFDDSRWPHATKGDTDKAQVVAGTPFDICGRNGPAWLFRSNIKAAL